VDLALDRPISESHTQQPDSRRREALFFSRFFVWEAKGSDLGKVTAVGRASITMILFIPLSATQDHLDWVVAGAEVILLRCPICSEDSMIGSGFAAPLQFVWEDVHLAPALSSLPTDCFLDIGDRSVAAT
jgi:hypothetical protein